MWFSVVITDTRGKTIFKSSSLDKNGNINEDSVVYYTQLGKEKDGCSYNHPIIGLIGHDVFCFCRSLNSPARE